MSPPTIEAFESVQPSTADVVDPVPPREGGGVADVKAKAFRGGPIDLSLFPLHPDHISRHI